MREPGIELLPPPTTVTEHYDHMVNDHGHDDYDNNRDLIKWGQSDWEEQHREYHGDDSAAEHAHQLED